MTDIVTNDAPTLQECWEKLKPVMTRLHKRIQQGAATPVIFRDAARRLSSMLDAAGTKGELEIESEILDSLTALSMAASIYIYR